MKLIAISDKKILEDFLISKAGNYGAEFLVSLEWSEIIKKGMGEIETLGVYSGSELVAVFNVIKKDFKLNLFYFYLPRGPIFSNSLNAEKRLELWQFLLSEFKKKGALFLRVEPVDTLPAEIKAISSINLQPQETLMLDLSLTENELLSAFHPKTRYNINLARKKGIKIIQDNNLVNDFWSLMTETGKRDGFKIHDQKHYEILTTAQPKFIKLFVAKKDDKVIAAGLFSFYGQRVTYLHGASSHSFRQFMAPYLLQWTVISEAKSAGYKYYDFYGIDELKWPGVTRFKLGFGGFRVIYAGTKDIILKPVFYNLYNILRRLKRSL